VCCDPVVLVFKRAYYVLMVSFQQSLFITPLWSICRRFSLNIGDFPTALICIEHCVAEVLINGLL